MALRNGVARAGPPIEIPGHVTTSGTGYAMIDDKDGPVVVGATKLAVLPALRRVCVWTGLREQEGTIMRKLGIVLIAAAFTAALSVPSAAQYEIKWYSLNSGGGESAGGGYKLNASVGQSVAGFAKSTSFLHWIGFWSGEVPSPQVVADIGAAKKLADGTFVSIAGKIATSSATEFSGFFYLEDESRANGIRVAAQSADVVGLLRGSVLNVVGTLGTTAAGERQITGPVVIITGSATPLEPLVMRNSSVGGANFGTPPAGQYGVAGATKGLNNVGLLVETVGLVTAVEPGFVVIDDGSGTPVRVSVTNLAAPPVLNDYITIVGLSSLHKPGAERLRLVLPRANSDLTKH